MQIVIDIPEEIYQKIKETSMVISGRRSGKRIDWTLFNAINNGTPLPKNHGRLIDADNIFSYSEDLYEAIDLAPTIIEENKGE